jgi:hypothetical protein
LFSLFESIVLKQDDRLGDMMLQYATLVKLYSSYAQNLDEAFDTLRTRPEFAVFIFDAEANVLCEGRPLAEIVRYGCLFASGDSRN